MNQVHASHAVGYGTDGTIDAAVSPLADKALRGDPLSGARLIRYLEENDPRGVCGLKLLYPHTGRAFILGITGPAGAGKSTLVDRVVGSLRARGMKVGVIAVDPSSPFTGGAVLGDRIRMQRHATDQGVFVRSMATRGRVGGLAKATSDAVLVLDAMGYDVIIVETVGVGQDEIDVAGLAHTTTVINLPGMGDEIQAIKAGILEIGDVFVVNKADRPGADDAAKQLMTMLDMRPFGDAEWRPPVLKTVATSGEGITELVDACLAHRKHLADTGRLKERAIRRELTVFEDVVKQMALEQIRAASTNDSALRSIMEDLRTRKIDPYSAAEQIFDRIRVAAAPPSGAKRGDERV